MGREKQKDFFSWISLVGGVISLFYAIYGTMCILHKVSDVFMVEIWALLLVAFIAVFSGIYSAIGQVRKFCRIRALVGMILGILFCGIFLFWCVRLIEW